MKSLGELIASSAEVESKYGVRSYSQEATFKKEFGTVYYSEKVAFYDEKHRILEIRITMGSTDDSNDHLHVIRMAFKDIQGQVFNSKKELLEYLGYGENSRKRVGRFRSSVAETAAKESFDNELYEGIVIPCTQDPTESNSFSDYMLPSGRFFYSKEGITLNNPCAVSCSCSSYRYTFAEFNSRDKAHLGPKPAKYQPVKQIRDITKYDPKTKEYKRVGAVEERIFRNTAPVLNKTKKPGLCKHLMLFALLLLSGEIIKGYQNVGELRKELKDMEKTRGASGEIKLGKQEKYKNKVGTTENYLRIKEVLDKTFTSWIRDDERSARKAYEDALNMQAQREKILADKSIEQKYKDKLANIPDAEYQMTDYGRYMSELAGKDLSLKITDLKSLNDVKRKFYNAQISEYSKELWKGAFGRRYSKKKK